MQTNVADGGECTLQMAASMRESGTMTRGMDKACLDWVWLCSIDTEYMIEYIQ